MCESNLCNNLVDLTKNEDCLRAALRPGPKKRKYDDEDDETEQRRLLANTQERVRMQKINIALDELRKHLPQQFHLYHRRMSKIRTLRLAMNYIRSLTETIHEDNIRRQLEYRETMGHLHSVHMPEPKTPNMVEKCDGKIVPFQSPSSMMKIYPYLGPLCAGSTDVRAMYQTPETVIARSRQGFIPRYLNFNGMQKQETNPNTELIDSINDCEKQRYGCRFRGVTGTPEFRKTSRIATFTSPMMGLRNHNELDVSLLSCSSDTATDDARPHGTSDLTPLRPHGTSDLTPPTLQDIVEHTD